jgi:hypothetical protein
MCALSIGVTSLWKPWTPAGTVTPRLLVAKALGRSQGVPRNNLELLYRFAVELTSLRAKSNLDTTCSEPDEHHTPTRQNC